MADYNILNNLNELIGKKCTHNTSEHCNHWDESNTIQCKVKEFEIVLCESFPYDLSISVMLEPLDLNNVDPDLNEDLQLCGVPLDSIVFDI